MKEIGTLCKTCGHHVTCHFGYACGYPYMGVYNVRPPVPEDEDSCTCSGYIPDPYSEWEDVNMV